MAKKLSIVQPALTISKKGKIGLRGPLLRFSGFNFSRSGVSYTKKVPGGSVNTRSGARIPLAKKTSPWLIVFLGLAGLITCCLIGAILYGISQVEIERTATATASATLTVEPSATRTIIWKTVEPYPTFTTVPTSTRVPTFTPYGYAICDCSENLYNCDSFDSMNVSPQSCFDYCNSLGVGDIHQLDADEDGNVCEPPQ